ncbi:transposase, partial [Enterococcus faecalis ATCC 4200]
MYTFPVISVTKCVSMIVRKSVMILKWCIKPHLKKVALEARGAFAEKWKTSYPKVVESILSNDHLLTFYDFPLAIRKSIYSTNLIESFNKQIKKYSHRKEQFQNEESMERFLVSSFDTYNQKFLGRSHKGFQQAEGELEQMLSQLI